MSINVRVSESNQAKQTDSQFGEYFRCIEIMGMRPNLNLSRFKRRYRLALELRDDAFLGSSRLTPKLYTSVLRITLAYGALESLEAFENKKNQAVMSVSCARAYKSEQFKKFRMFLERESEESVKGELIKLADSKRDANIRPVINALRHSMVHGQFNPTAANLLNLRSLELVIAIENAFLKSLEHRSKSIFQQEVDRLKRN